MLGFYLKLNKKSIVGLVAVLLLSSVFGSSVLAVVPNDPKYYLQQGYYNQIGAPKAWEHTTGSGNVTVAIIDVGVDIYNSDLKDNIWINQDEIAGNNIDDDKNGYIDDVHGWNFIEDNNDPSISVILESDDSGAIQHGTVLAGLIGEKGNNNLLGAGLNWNVSIMPIRAIDNSGSGILFNIAKAVNYAVENGADIISLSFVGSVTYPDLTAALYNAYSKGVLVVVAAGNSRNDGSGNENLSKVKQYPICLDWDYAENWILGVASVDEYDKLSRFADYGSCIDISAPGEKIFSTQKYAPQYGYTEDFSGGWYGTSFSAPLVAGSAALIKSIRPDWKAKEIRDVLLRSAIDIDYLNPGFAGQMGYGRLDVGKAVQMALDSKNISSTSPKPAVVYTSKLVNKVIKKQKIYSVQVLADGKVLREFSIANYSNSFSKWAVTANLFVYARFDKNKIVLDVWELAGNKKVSSFVLPGFTGLAKVSVETVWGNSPNAVLVVKKGKVDQRVIVDVPSKSWKVE